MLKSHHVANLRSYITTALYIIIGVVLVTGEPLTAMLPAELKLQMLILILMLPPGNSKGNISLHRSGIPS